MSVVLSEIVENCVQKLSDKLYIFNFGNNQKKTNMNLLLRIIITALLVMLISYFMPGISVDSFGTAVIVAIVLGLLNLVVKPILVLLTLPITVITLGLFLLVINALVILLCDYIVGGFDVSSFLMALVFSIILSLFQSIIYSLGGNS